MIAVLIPSVRPFLARAAVRALDATTKYARVHVLTGGAPHGVKLDNALAALSPQVRLVVTMDDDAAPLRMHWLPWLTERKGSRPWAGFIARPSGAPHPLGAVYDAAWLRDRRVSFVPRRVRGDVGDSLADAATPPPFIAWPAPPQLRPLWLRRADVAIDDRDRLVWGHLGGGTIGANAWRMPTRLWPLCLSWYFRRGRHA